MTEMNIQAELVSNEEREKPLDRALRLLTELAEYGGNVGTNDVKWLAGHINLKHTQANKARNQRVALRQINKAHRWVKREMEMLRLLQDNLLRSAVDTLQASGFTVPTPKIQERLLLLGGYVPNERKPDMVPVPCGNIQKEAGPCVDGNLCGHCLYILELEARGS